MALPPIANNYEFAEEKTDILFDGDETNSRLKEFVDALARFVLGRGESEGKIDPEFLIGC